MNKWINKNYLFLEKWSKIWANDRWSELISYYTLYLHKNWEKFDSIPDDDERLKFTQTWFQNNVRWTNSEYNKCNKVNDLEESYDIPDEDYTDIQTQYCEIERIDIRNWFIDIHTEFGEEKANKLIKLRQVYLTLETSDKVLYDLYFTNMKSMRDIGTQLSIPLSAVFNMITELKNKIKNYD